MDAIPVRAGVGNDAGKASTDAHHDLNSVMEHYIGIDVGTGSARACIINANGDIVGLASENIGLWQPQQGYYVGLPPISRPLTNDMAYLYLEPEDWLSKPWTTMLMYFAGTIYK